MLLSSLQMSAAQMAMPGAFATDDMGGATYKIPIATPPGTAGMAPTLSLNYNTRLPNGIAGVGWMLSGLPSIGRCPQTKAQDNQWKGIKYDSGDRYCLDGQRLIAVSGTYGADNTEYRTEIESYSKIISHGTAGTGQPAWFEVKTKTGQTMEFGNTTDSRVLAKGISSARSWALNKVKDTVGNYFTVTYTVDTTNGQAYPSQIDYTGNASASLTPYNSVRFTYTTTRTDIPIAYQAGSSFRTTVLLTNIKTYAGANLVSDYRLTYQQGSSTSRNRLANVKLCDTSGTCMPQTSFAWTAELPLPPSTSPWPLANAANWMSTEFTANANPSYVDDDKNPRFVMDVNGDSRPDLVGFSNNQVKVALNTGSGFSSVANWYSTNFTINQGNWTNNKDFPRMLVDVDGDGLPDIVAFDNSVVRVALNTGSGFANQSVWHTGFGPNSSPGYDNNDKNPRFLVDVNGDGLPDIVGFSNNDVMVALNTGSATTGFATATSWYSTNFTVNQGNWNNNTTHPRFLVDVDGDGLPDIVGFDHGSVRVAKNTGSSFNGFNSWLSNEMTINVGWVDNNQFPRSLIDINGDGLPDIIGFGQSAVKVALNTGTGFAAPTNWITNDFTIDQGWLEKDKGPRTLVDMNGDGLPDIVGFGTGAVKVALNTGSSFASSGQLLTTEFTYNTGYISNKVKPRYVIDMNGDGLPDVIGFGASNVMVSLNNGTIMPDMIATVTEGLGVQTTATYKPMTDATVYTKQGGNTIPTVDIIGAMYVVSKVDKSNGIGGNYSMSYAYEGARSNVLGRGFLGFQKLTVTDLQTNIVETRTFRQDFPFIGQMATQTKKLGTLTLGSTTNTYSSVGSAAPYRVKLDQAVVTGNDLNGSALPSTTSVFQYDTYGNATSIEVSTTHNSNLWKKTTSNTYTNDTTNWFLGRLTGSSVASQIP